MKPKLSRNSREPLASQIRTFFSTRSLALVDPWINLKNICKFDSKVLITMAICTTDIFCQWWNKNRNLCIPFFIYCTAATVCFKANSMNLMVISILCLKITRKVSWTTIQSRYIFPLTILFSNVYITYNSFFGKDFFYFLKKKFLIVQIELHIGNLNILLNSTKKIVSSIKFELKI